MIISDEMVKEFIQRLVCASDTKRGDPVWCSGVGIEVFFGKHDLRNASVQYKANPVLPRTGPRGQYEKVKELVEMCDTLCQDAEKLCRNHQPFQTQSRMRSSGREISTLKPPKHPFEDREKSSYDRHSSAQRSASSLNAGNAYSTAPREGQQRLPQSKQHQPKRSQKSGTEYRMERDFRQSYYSSTRRDIQVTRGEPQRTVERRWTSEAQATFPQYMLSYIRPPQPRAVKNPSFVNRTAELSHIAGWSKDNERISRQPSAGGSQRGRSQPHPDLPRYYDSSSRFLRTTGSARQRSYDSDQIRQSARDGQDLDLRYIERMVKEVQYVSSSSVRHKTKRYR